MKHLIWISLLLILLALIGGCSREQAPAGPAQSGKVVVTAAYERHFGPAPPVDKGAAYGFVIYFPSAKEPGKVVPFPFFTFDEATLKKVAVQRLLGGMDAGSYQGEYRSFPAGARLISLSEDRGTVELTFNKELLVAKDSGILSSIVLTLRQFNGVNAVRILLEGEKEALLVQGADDKAVAALPPPRLLNVIAMRDKGADAVEEVDLFFDRPVDVKELRISAENGTAFEGDLYHSVFDMAAVLKPKEPAQFREKMPVRVRWKIVDKHGRSAEGEGVWPLEIRQHDR